MHRIRTVGEWTRGVLRRCSHDENVFDRRDDICLKFLWKEGHKSRLDVHGCVRSVMKDACGDVDSVRCDEGLTFLRTFGQRKLPVVMRYVEYGEVARTG